MIDGKASLPAHVLRALIDVTQSEAYRQLYFDFHYLTDELIFYGLKGYAGHFVFQLANLLYSLVLRHPMFALVRRLKSALPPSQRPKDRNSTAAVTPRATPLTRAAAAAAGVQQPYLPHDDLLTEWPNQLIFFLAHYPQDFKGTRVLRLLLHQITVRRIPSSRLLGV
jgi:hypothetical protein